MLSGRQVAAWGGRGGAGRLAKETWRRVLTRIPAGAGSPRAAPLGALGARLPSGRDGAPVQSRTGDPAVTESLGDPGTTIPAAGTQHRAPARERAGMWGGNGVAPGAATLWGTWPGDGWGHRWPHPVQHGWVFVPKWEILQDLKKGRRAGVAVMSGTVGRAGAAGPPNTRRLQVSSPELPVTRSLGCPSTHQLLEGRVPRGEPSTSCSWGPPCWSSCSSRCSSRGG